MARAGDAAETAALYDKQRKEANKLDVHVAECVILREHIQQEILELKKQNRDLRNIMLSVAGGVGMLLLGALGTLILALMGRLP